MAIIILVVFYNSSVFAQEFDAGLKAGINSSKVTGTYATAKTGYVYGVFIEIKFKNQIGIHVEGLIAQQNSSRGDLDIEMTYFKVPLVCKYHTSNKFNFYAGPQLGFVIDDNFNEFLIPQDGGTDQLKSEPIDISGVIGIGYEIINGLCLDGRFDFGFNDVYRLIYRSDLATGTRTLALTASLEYTFF